MKETKLYNTKTKPKNCSPLSRADPLPPTISGTPSGHRLILRETTQMAIAKRLTTTEGETKGTNYIYIKVGNRKGGIEGREMGLERESWGGERRKRIEGIQTGRITWHTE